MITNYPKLEELEEAEHYFYEKDILSKEHKKDDLITSFKLSFLRRGKRHTYIFTLTDLLEIKDQAKEEEREKCNSLLLEKERIIDWLARRAVKKIEVDGLTRSYTMYVYDTGHNNVCKMDKQSDAIKEILKQAKVATK